MASSLIYNPMEITIEKLIKLGFYQGEFPELLYELENTTLIVCVPFETKFYFYIRQWDGKEDVNTIYIPKDFTNINQVIMILGCTLSDKK
jgi:hypothetical protein